MGDPLQTTLELTFAADRVSVFNPLLQQGVRVACLVGCSLGELLGRQWGIEADYLARRVSTLFLNARAIDDVENALVVPDAVIALSGAMPGLVGATMRRGGYYAAMRGAMTHTEQAGEAASTPATVRVKLFNLLLGELGPGFLERGILISGAEFQAFVRDREGDFRYGCRSARLNGREIDPALLPENDDLTRIETIRLVVAFRGEE